MSYSYLNSTKVTDTDIAFKIDPITREITPKNPKKTVLMQNDHNSERFTFEIPRFIEGRDVGKCNVVQVCYINIDGRSGGSTTGVYTVDDLEVYPFINDVLTCTWLISQNATSRAGKLTFMLRFAYINDDGTVEYAWSSGTYSEVSIVESLDSDESFNNEYVDVIQQWKIATKEEFMSFIDQMVKAHTDVAQISKNASDIATLSTETATLEARMNTFTTLAEGSTTGDAELADVRVGVDGTEYSNAGEAVRGQVMALGNELATVLQKNGVSNPLQPLPISAHYYYKGSDVFQQLSILTAPQYNITNLPEYETLDDSATTTSYCMGAKLVTPLNVSEVMAGDYVYIIKTDHPIEGRVWLGYYMNWAPNNTNWVQYISLPAGYSVIYVKGGLSNDAGHTEFRYAYFKTTENDFTAEGVTDFQMYLVRGSALMGYIDQVAAEVSGNASFAWNAQNALSAKNAGATRLPLDKYMSNTLSNLDSGTYILEETGTGYRFAVTEDHHTDSTTTKWFQAFATDLGVKTEAVKKTIMTKLVVNDPDGTKTALTRLCLNNTWYHWNGKSIDHGIVNVADVDLSAYADDEHIYLVWGIAAGSDSDPQWHSHTWDVTMTLMELPDGYVLADDLKNFDPDDYYNKKEVDELCGKTEKKIICWGDSLTAMGGWTGKLATLSGFTVVNCGTGGENSNVIAARQGADCIVINNLTIPATTDAKFVTDYTTKFTTYMGKTVAPLLQGGTAHVNPCRIGDIEGTLAWTGSAWNDTTGVWTFTRSEAGEEVVINRPTQLTTYADRTYNNGQHIHIFFVGTNDGAFNVDDMIAKIRLMIDRSGTSEYLVMGLTRIQSEGYKEKFKAAFGRKWLDLHGYLVAYGLEDSGITPTDADNTAIASDLVPPSLLMDAVHYTDKTRELVGIQVYNRLRDLHYFD